MKFSLQTPREGWGECVVAKATVKDALQRIHKALAKNPDLSPFDPIPYGELGGVGGGAASEGLKKKSAKEADIRLSSAQIQTPQRCLC